MANTTAAKRLAKEETSAVRSLRSGIFAKISNILDESNAIADSTTRLAIQSACLDLVVEVEEVIDGYSLETSMSQAV